MAVMQKPYFSIIIPVYNRAEEIKRAINSCLNQEFSDFEVIVVDDASTDTTAEIVRKFLDNKIVLLKHTENQGVCMTRNTGIDSSSGEWLLLLDSDDEFLPGALQTIFQYASVCSPEIDRIGFVYQRDDGGISPNPMPSQTILDYVGFITWRTRVTESDFFHCTRRKTFKNVRFSPGRAYEDLYLLDFAARYKTKMIPNFVAIIHTDSGNRASNLSIAERAASFLRDASDQHIATNELLSRHGQALCSYAPCRYRIYQKARVLYALLSGKKRQGSKLAWQYLREYPFCLQGWIIGVAGMIGPQFLAKIKAFKIKAQT